MKRFHHPSWTGRGICRRVPGLCDNKSHVHSAAYRADAARPSASSLSHPDWLFELKYDGFRALAYVERDSARLVSRNGNTFTTFSDLCENLRRTVPHQAVLDGEIACLDGHGRSHFNRLLFRRGIPLFCAFDLLWLDGRDLRHVPLIRRKRVLRSIIPRRSSCLLFVNHVERQGERLFRLVCEEDLEGIVAKHRQSPVSPRHQRLDQS